MEQPQPKTRPFLKALLIGCGAVAALFVVLIVALGIWLFTGPEGGVRLGNELETYVQDYIAEHRLIEPGEEILAYYDVTISMDFSEAAIVTSERVIYHTETKTTVIPLSEIDDIRHHYESFVGDIIVIQADSGQTMKIEIAPLNQGETFKDVLMSAWQRTDREEQEEPTEGEEQAS